MDGRIVKPLRHNGMAYSGINVLMLWGAALEAGFLSPHWMTFRQAKELGAKVRKGERGNPVAHHGGAVAFVTAWLDHEATRMGWSNAQLSLF